VKYKQAKFLIPKKLFSVFKNGFKTFGGSKLDAWLALLLEMESPKVSKSVFKNAFYTFGDSNLAHHTQHQ